MEKGVFEGMIPKRLETENGPVAYWVSDSPAQRPALVFLHGLTANHTLFEKQASHFQGRFRVLCWDAPAHGQSRPYARFTYARAAEHLKAILDKERIERAVLIGQSMGGFVSQAFLKRYGALAAGFIGIDTTPFGLGYYSRSDQWWLRQIEWMSRCYPHGALVKGIARGCVCTRPAYENMLSTLEQYEKRELCHLMGIGYADFLKENGDMDIPCPVLLLLGERDRLGKVRQYCEAWQRRTGYPLHIIENAAHNANVDNPERVNAEIEAFVSGLE